MPLFRRRKLTGDETYNHWITEIKRARSARMPIEKNWRRWYNIVDDALWAGKARDGHAPSQINQLAAILENVIPSISFRAGIVEIRAFSMEDMLSAAIWEKSAQWILQKQGVVDELQSAIFDALVLGDGLFKIGHSVLPQLSEPQWNAGLATERAADQVSVYGMNWPLFEFLPDYSAIKWKRQRFFVHQYDKHIEEIKDNPLYDKKQADKIHPNRTIGDMIFRRADEIDKKKDYVAVQEIHDLINGRLMIVSDTGGSTDFLYNDVEPFGMIPVERLAFFDRPSTVWGKGITQTIEQHLIDLAKIDDYAMNVLRKEALLKIGVDASRWTKDNIAKLETSGDSIIPLMGDVAGSFEVLDYGGASQNFTYERNRQSKMSTIRELAGSGRMQQGLHETGVSSATESSLLQSNADVITQWRSNKFSEFVSRVLEKMLFIVSQTYTPERIAKMVGIEGDTVAAVLRGEPYDPSKYILSYGQAALADRADRREKLESYIGLFGPALNPAVIMRQYADVLGIEYTDEMIIPGVPIGGAQGGQQQGGQQATPGFRPEEAQQIENTGV